MPAHALRTDVGLRRRHNEDTGLADPSHGLYLVADGVGGQDAGERASQMTAAAFRRSATELDALRRAWSGNPGKESRDRLLDALDLIAQEASREVWSFGQARSLQRPSTTLTACVEAGGCLFTVHVGDSRAYLLRRGELQQLTEDHTLVNEYVRAGTMTPEQALESRHRNVITRAVGALPSVRADLFSVDLVPGDRVLLCSDGLTDMVGDSRIAELLATRDPDQAAGQLVEAALEGGGRDNVTVLLIDPEPGPDAHAALARAEALRRFFLFSGLPLPALVRVSRLAHEVQAAPGQEIVREGAPGRTLYVVVDGALSVRRNGVELAVLGPGEHFGEMALATAGPRTATVVSTGSSTLLEIDRAGLDRFSRRDPALANVLLWRLLERSSQRLAQTSGRLAGGGRPR